MFNLSDKMSESEFGSWGANMASQKIPLYALFTAFSLFAAFAYRTMSKERPLVGYPMASIPGKSARESWLLDGRKLVEEAEQEYDGPFQIMSGTGPKLILPNKYAHELRDHPFLSLNKAFVQDFFTEYHGFEPFLEGTRDDGVISDTVRTKLTQSLGLITGDLVDETNVSMPHIFGDSTMWTSVLLKDAILNLVARLSSRVFLGEELCRNEEWLRIAKSYAVDALTATYLMRMAPSLLRPIAYWLIPQCRRSRQAVQCARKLIDPEVKKRKKLVDDALQSGAKPSKISDAIGWMYQVAAGRPVDFVCAQMQLTLAAVHTTTEVLTQAILDLCERPELVQKLREEVIEVLGDEGWAKTSFYKLKLMDSFFKESQRFTPLVSTAMNRLVEKDITLSDGRFLPKGIRINVLTDFRNPEKYPNPDEFDAMRFVPMRQGQGSENASQLASTSSEHTLFGHGRHACPGRFFAVNEMKIILAQFLLEYDLRAKEGLTELQPQAFETSIGVNPAVTIEIRRRNKSADVRIEKRE